MTPTGHDELVSQEAARREAKGWVTRALDAEAELASVNAQLTAERTESERLREMLGDDREHLR